MRDKIAEKCCPYGCDAHFEQAVKDSERLEWLVRKEAFPMKSKEGWCLTSDGNTCWGVAAKTWRDAIDEAMRDSDEHN